MSATEYQFRGVTFGGFNRRDVLTYVESTVSEHGRQVEELKKELKLAEEANGAQAAALAEAEVRGTRYAEENSRLSAELAAAQRKLSEHAAALAGAQEELSVLQEQVRTMKPGAEAYARIKDRAASIEMEAHLRAQTILDEAEARTKTTRIRAEEWLRRVQADYDRLRTDVDATISHAAGELGRIQKSLGGMTADFSVHDDELTELLDNIRTELSAESPEPAMAGKK